ncbi:MAG TPA: amidohydrolase family protein [Humisphaera sp.]
MSVSQLVRGPLLVPRPGGHVDYYPDGVLAADPVGTLLYAGSWSGLACQLGDDRPPVRRAAGVMLPPLLDVHTHVPQHPIRGRFVEGVPDDAPGGKLLAGLQRNVFPAEAKCGDPAHAEAVARAFAADTLGHGVVGGMAYMTVSAAATEAALGVLPETWSVGMVLMDQNCPAYLRTDGPAVEADHDRLAGRFGRRVVVTDRFAVAVGTPLRHRAVAVAARLGLRTQTHLNEQVAEKAFVERELYPQYDSYTDVYRRDGLLDHACVLAHCVHMRPDEWGIVRDSGSAIAHCPTSNLHLGSGVMDLDEVLARGISYAVATDVGASPTVSLLAEVGRFLQVHAGRSTRATLTEGLYRVTLGAADLLGLDRTLGRLEAGRPMSFIEVATRAPDARLADEAILGLIPENLDAPVPAVRRVTLGGTAAFVPSLGTPGEG